MSRSGGGGQQELTLNEPTETVAAGNQVWDNITLETNHIVEPDKNGNVLDTSKLYYLTDGGKTLVRREVTFYNDNAYRCRMGFTTQYNTQMPNVDGGFDNVSRLHYTYKDYVEPGASITFPEEVIHTTTDTPALDGTYGKVNLPHLMRMLYRVPNGDKMIVDLNTVEIGQSYVRVKFDWDAIRYLHLPRTVSILASGYSATGASWGYQPPGSTMTLTHLDSGTEYVRDSPIVYDLPLGKYKWELSHGFPNAVDPSMQATSGTFEYKTNYQQQSLQLAQPEGLYTNIKSNLFYDMDSNGLFDESVDIQINDPDESSNIELAPFTNAGATNEIFVKDDPKTKQVDRVGSIYARYVGTKYKADLVTAGTVINTTDILQFNDKLVPAPVYVYGSPIVSFYYDIDRDGKYGSGVDSLITGTLSIEGKEYVVTNGKVTIPKIKSGKYDYTLTDSVSGRTLTDSLVVTPQGTPNTQGIIAYNTSVGFDIDIDKSIQVLVDETPVSNGVIIEN